VTAVLEHTGITYMVTGSLASSMQGEPRATHDVDLVVAIPDTSVGALLASFPEDEYYLDPESVRTAIADRDMFNLIDMTSGDKVDFWMLTDDAFDQERFARREVQSLLGLKLFVTTPEDTILQKLRWARLAGGSEKQVGDAAGVYEVQLKRLDQGYLDRWAATLGVEDLLQRIRERLEPAS
jgi:hypothetical protein